MTKNKLQKLSSLGVAAVVLGSVLAPVGVSAIPTGSSSSANTDVAATVNSVIEVTTSGNAVAFDITPKAGGAISSKKDVVTVSTNSSTGYTLAIQADQTLTNQNGAGNGETFGAAAGSVETPLALGANTWGFAAPGSDSEVTPGFSTSYSQLNSVGVTLQQPGYDKLWAAVPVDNGVGPTEALPFKVTSGIANALTTDVWFAANADMLQPTGVYTAVVTYTATTNVEA